MCYPAGYPAAGAAPLPWLIYLHAGGFVDCSQQSSECPAMDPAARVPAVVVVPAYSLAPTIRSRRRRRMRSARSPALRMRAGSVEQRFALGGEEAGGNLRSRWRR